MNIQTKSIIGLLFALGISSQGATAAEHSVGSVVWKTDTTAEINTSDVPANMSQLIFVRFADNLPTTTNANLSVDDDYQISLASNHLSEVLVCSGAHELSTQTTANKSNDLLYNNKKITTAPKQTYFYRVQVTAQGDTTINSLGEGTKVDGKPLVDYLATLPRQIHQISRVVPDCSTPSVVQVPQPIVVIEPTPVAPKPTPVQPQPEPIEFNKPIELDVLFNFDSATIVPQYYERINEMAQFIKDNDATVLIEGHTDSRGNETYNMNLSKQRADAVKALLVSQYGVDATKITTQGFGETRPIASNDTDAGRHQNRRVVAIAHP